MKLINWHYFFDETLDFMGESTVITGDNGAGKSTIVDALQVILLANMNRIKFNSSAHEQNTQRSLISYLRGKTGTDDREFLRNYDFTTYLVAEIEHTNTGKKYLIGAVFDYHHGTSNEYHTFFKIDEQELVDSLFYSDEDTPKTQEEFFRFLKKNSFKYKPYRNDLIGYSADIQQLLGGIKESFFSLFPKGISFSPITNLRKFVYEYILDDQEEIDISKMQDYVEQVQELKNVLSRTKSEIEYLELIQNKYKEIETINNNIHTGQYMERKATVEVERNSIEILSNNRMISQEKLESLEKEKIVWEQKRDLENENIKNIRKEIHTHSISKKETDLLDKQKELCEQAEKISKQKQNNESKLRQEIKERKEVSSLVDYFKSPSILNIELQKGTEAWEGLLKGEQNFPQDYITINRHWHKAHQWLQDKNYELDLEKKRLVSEKEQLENTISKLERNEILSEDSPTKKLKNLLKEHLISNNGEVPVHVLCEVIEVSNEKWKNAIEGYLHTQKFDILVPLGYFDEALAIYERFKFSHKIERVGLVNTDQIQIEKRKILSNSLAEEVVSKVDYAKSYVDWLLGSIIKCESEKELKNHKRSITSTCMVYQNFTARQIPVERYKQPYIGRNAIEIQLKYRKKELEEVNDRLALVDEELTMISPILKITADKLDRYESWRKDWESIILLPSIYEQIATTEQELMYLDKSEIEKLKEKERELEEFISSIQKQINKKSEDIGETRKDIETTEGNITLKFRQLEENEIELEQYLSSISKGLVEICKEKWEQESKSKSAIELKKNYENNTKGLITRKNNLWEPFIAERQKFNQLYEFSEFPASPTNESYDNRLSFLHQTGLVDYEQKVEEAEKKAEQAFREDFIAKLKEQIEKAEDDFKMLKRALKGMTFGTDQYEFKVMGRKGMEDFYNLLKDPNLDSGMSIFSDYFDEKYGHVLKELFEELSNAQKTGERTDYIDYRTYLDFELEVKDEQGNIMRYSKVALEKSGGETQVPFYVSILASFYYTYQMMRKEDTFRLVIFDEAFNRMDSDRVEEAIKFIRLCGFQAIIVAPTGRVQQIAPHFNNTMVVLKDEFTSYVAPFSRKMLLELEEEVVHLDENQNINEATEVHFK
ncbi:ATP-binding protein [Ureibacillus xyleni]|uniref:ATP-binding protein n=1 Tax=Ureibacillus xyleni TaxID=614648 RepID=UPI00137A6E3E|nr:SbcC/MukB-like Walker B domain-containing protein [Ureibacillus xyleni]